MKRVIICICCVLMLAGCTSNKFNYNDEISNVLQNLNKDFSSCFVEKTLEIKIADKSISYKRLFDCILQDCYFDIPYAMQKNIVISAEYFNKDKLVELTLNDKNGFLHDLNNLKSLGMSDAVLEDFICDYLVIAITRCEKERREFHCELEQCNSSPFLIVTNNEIIQNILTDVNEVIAELMCFDIVLEDTVDEKVIKSVKDLDIGQVVMLNYGYEDHVIPCTLEVKSVIKSLESVQFLEQLSDNNKGLVDSSTVVISYEIHNYSDNDVIISSKFFDASLDDSMYYPQKVLYSGISKEYNLAGNSSITVTDVIQAKHNNLVWYDEYAGELYNINTK